MKAFESNEDEMMLRLKLRTTTYLIKHGMNRGSVIKQLLLSICVQCLKWIIIRGTIVLLVLIFAANRPKVNILRIALLIVPLN